MKSKISTLIAAMVLAATALIVVPTARADKFQWFYLTSATNLYTVSNATATATSGTNYFLPAADVDYVFEASITTTNIGTSNTVFGFNTSITDSNSFTTTLPLTATIANSSSNTTVGHVVLSRTNFIGVQQIRWDSTSTTQTNSAKINWARFGWKLPSGYY